MLMPFAGEGRLTLAAVTYCCFRPALQSHLAFRDFGEGLVALDVLYTARSSATAPPTQECMTHDCSDLLAQFVCHQTD